MRDINILKESGIDLDSSLEYLGDMEMYDETLNDFLEEMKTRLKEMNKYKDINDMANYSILVHALKSDSKYLGFTELASLALNHEIESKANNINYINNNYNELITELNKIINASEKYLL